MRSALLLGHFPLSCLEGFIISIHIETDIHHFKLKIMFANFYIFFLVALIPLLVGGIYYGPLFKSAWMKVNGFTEESLKGANMGVIFGLTYLFGLMAAFFLTSVVIHQTHIFSMLLPEVGEAGSVTQEAFKGLMGEYGGRYRSFGHGALHAGVMAIFLVLPILAVVSLFERRGWKYIFIHLGYWFITLALMGGAICQFIEYTPVQ